MSDLPREDRAGDDAGAAAGTEGRVDETDATGDEGTVAAGGEETGAAGGEGTGAAGDEGTEADDADEPSLAGVFGGRDEDAPPRPELGPESPAPENVLFVALGVLLALLVVYRTVSVLVA